MAYTDPRTIASLVDYYRADTGVTLTAGRVSAWADQVGANNLTQGTAGNRPFLSDKNGRPSIFFDSTSNQALINAALSFAPQAGSLFLICETPFGAQSGTGVMATFGVNKIYFFGAQTVISDQLIVNDGGNTGNQKDFGNSYVPQGINLIGFTGGAGATGGFINDTVLATNAALANVATTALSIGANSDASNLGWTGRIYEVMVFNAALTTAQVLGLSAYAAEVYGRPRGIGNANIMFSADSIGGATGADNRVGWNDRDLLGMTRDIITWNFAIGSQKMSDEVTTSVTYATFLKSAAAKNFIFAAMGTNDLAANTGLVATLESNYQTFCLNCAAAGVKPIACTLLPRNSNFAGAQSSGQFETDRLAFNAWLRANWQTIGCAALCDWGATTTTMGNSAQLTGTVYYADGIHPTSYGHSLLAPFAKAVLLNLGVYGNTTYAGGIFKL